MDREQVPQEWVGRQVELWTLAPHGTGQDTGQLLHVNELGILFCRGVSKGDEEPTELLARFADRAMVAFNLSPREAVVMHMNFQATGTQLEAIREADRAELVFDIAAEE